MTAEQCQVCAAPAVGFNNRLWLCHGCLELSIVFSPDAIEVRACALPVDSQDRADQFTVASWLRCVDGMPIRRGRM